MEDSVKSFLLVIFIVVCVYLYFNKTAEPNIYARYSEFIEKTENDPNSA